MAVLGGVRKREKYVGNNRNNRSTQAGYLKRKEQGSNGMAAKTGQIDDSLGGSGLIFEHRVV
jgi:hypothetical protein